MPRGHLGAIWLLLLFARGGEPARGGGGARGKIKPICTLYVQGETKCEAKKADKWIEMWNNDTQKAVLLIFINPVSLVEYYLISFEEISK